jgi:hypothetical protein
MSTYRRAPAAPRPGEVVELRPGLRGDTFMLALVGLLGMFLGLWELGRGTSVSCHRRAGVLEPCLVTEGTMFGRRTHSEVLPEGGVIFVEKYGYGKNVSHTLSVREGSFGRPIAHELPTSGGRESLATELQAFLADPNRQDFAGGTGWNGIAFVPLAFAGVVLLSVVLLVLRRVRVRVARGHVEISAFFWPLESEPRRMPIDDQSRFAVEPEGKSYSLVYRDRDERWSICSASRSLDIEPLRRVLHEGR